MYICCSPDFLQYVQCLIPQHFILYIDTDHQNLRLTKMDVLRPFQAIFSPTTYLAIFHKTEVQIVILIRSWFKSYDRNEKHEKKRQKIQKTQKNYRGSPLSPIFGTWKKSYYEKFVLVGTIQPISTSTNFTTQQLHSRLQKQV